MEKGINIYKKGWKKEKRMIKRQGEKRRGE